MTGEASNGELADEIAALTAVLGAHGSRLDDLEAAQPQDSGDGAERPVGVPAAVLILGVNGEAQLVEGETGEPTAAAADLLAWVAWLVRSHGLRDKWPLCWALHGGVLQAVAGLRVWHHEALRDTGTAGHALSAWYDRGYWPLLSRTLTAIVQQCGLSDHKDTSATHADWAERVTGADAMPAPIIAAASMAHDPALPQRDAGGVRTVPVRIPSLGVEPTLIQPCRSAWAIRNES